jgi:hypothetical protein
VQRYWKNCAEITQTLRWYCAYHDYALADYTQLRKNYADYAQLEITQKLRNTELTHKLRTNYADITVKQNLSQWQKMLGKLEPELRVCVCKPWLRNLYYAPAAPTQAQSRDGSGRTTSDLVREWGTANECVLHSRFFYHNSDHLEHQPLWIQIWIRKHTIS